MSPQADYVVSNGTGAAVRSDINGQLAAIVSNNSGASAPATTYAYMLWADTSTNLLKLRNGANSAWITVGDLTAANLGLATLASPTFTGTATIPTLTVSTAANIPLGSAASPTLYFTGDSNTGLYSPGADQVALSTGGTGRLFIDSSGRCGIGTSSPAGTLHLAATYPLLYLTDTDATGSARSAIGSPDGNLVYYANENNQTGGSHIFYRNGANESVRIDSSGRVGIGAASPLSIFDVKPSSNKHIVFSASASYASNAVVGVDDGGNEIALGIGGNTIQFFTGTNERARIDSAGRWLLGTSSVSLSTSKLEIAGTSNTNYLSILNTSASDADGNRYSRIHFRGTQSGGEVSTLASILVAHEGSADDEKGYLAFNTNDGNDGDSPTERMKITSNGIVHIGYDGSYSSNTTRLTSLTSAVSDHACNLYATNASYDATGYGVFGINVVRSANSAYTFAGFYSNNASDREFQFRGDGNGYCDGSWNGGGADYAEYFEWSDSNPGEEDRRGISVVLDGDKIREAVAGEDPIGVISGNPSVVGDAAWNKWSGKYLRDEFGTYIQEDYEVVNDEGETVVQQRRKLNPAYDPDQEYIPREQRPEWDCVGLMGKLRIRKGQVTGSRWIKMRDISDSVEEWLVR